MTMMMVMTSNGSREGKYQAARWNGGWQATTSALEMGGMTGDIGGLETGA